MARRLGKTALSPAVAASQFLVVESEPVKQSRVQIMNNVHVGYFLVAKVAMAPEGRASAKPTSQCTPSPIHGTRAGILLAEEESPLPKHQLSPGSATLSTSSPFSSDT